MDQERTTSEYMPASAVRSRYRITDVTLFRWLRDPTLQFPQPIVINRRRLFRSGDLDAWDIAHTRPAPVCAVNKRTAA
jgi:predicted DNA-binding transcriptional regulator AlpA